MDLRLKFGPFCSTVLLPYIYSKLLGLVGYLHPKDMRGQRKAPSAWQGLSQA